MGEDTNGTPAAEVDVATGEAVAEARTEEVAGGRTWAAALRAGWSRFQLWRHMRPFWGAILLIIAGILVLWGPLSLLRFAYLPGSMLWAGVLVGALLVVMGLLQLLMPAYAAITGAVGIVLSLVSLLVAFGGLGIGMLLGIIGGALGVAWHTASRTGTTNRRVFWATMAPSLLALLGMVMLVANGIVAIAAALPGTFTLTNGTLNAQQFHLYPGLSQSDSSTPVAVIQLSGTISNMTITRQFTAPVIGTVNLNLTAGQKTPVTISGLTVDATGQTADQANFQGMSISSGGAHGFDINAPSATFNNQVVTTPYLLVSGITLPGLTLSITH